MKNAIRIYLKKPQTYLAVIVALMAQLIFCLVWMTAYDGVLDRVDHLKIAIVNEDGMFGEEIQRQLRNSLPFEVVAASKETAMDDLLRRNVHLILTIPEKFSEVLTTSGTKAKMTYTLNDSNPQLTKSIMQSVADKLTHLMNQNAALQGTEIALQQMGIPSVQAAITSESLLNKIESEVQTLNPVNGMHNQMVPMMLVLASYVGAMLMAMNVHQVSESIGSSVCKWHQFAFRAIIIVAAAFLISIAGSSLIATLGGQMQNGFGIFWLFHFLTMLTFMFFAQMFLIVFGMAGMFLNMAMLSLQLVASGTIVPRETLNSFYHKLGDFLPATYSVDGIMNLQFGGVHTMRDIGMLFITIAVSIAIYIGAVFIKKQGNPMLATEASTLIKTTESTAS